MSGLQILLHSASATAIHLTTSVILFVCFPKSNCFTLLFLIAMDKSMKQDAERVLLQQEALLVAYLLNFLTNKLSLVIVGTMGLLSSLSKNPHWNYIKKLPLSCNKHNFATARCRNIYSSLTSSQAVLYVPSEPWKWTGWMSQSHLSPCNQKTSSRSLTWKTGSSAKQSD